MTQLLKPNWFRRSFRGYKNNPSENRARESHPSYSLGSLMSGWFTCTCSFWEKAYCQHESGWGGIPEDHSPLGKRTTMSRCWGAHIELLTGMISAMPQPNYLSVVSQHLHDLPCSTLQWKMWVPSCSVVLAGLCRRLQSSWSENVIRRDCLLSSNSEWLPWWPEYGLTIAFLFYARILS